MSTVHKMERALVGKGIDGVLHYVNKDPEDRKKALLNLVDVTQKVAGPMFQDKSYDAARAMISDENGKWYQYVNRLLNEVDPHVLKMTALNLGFEAAYFGTKTIREKRKELQCQVPWLILMDSTSACNMHCTGCWAAEYGHKLNLSFEDLDSIITQGKAFLRRLSAERQTWLPDSMWLWLPWALNSTMATRNLQSRNQKSAVSSRSE